MKSADHSSSPIRYSAHILSILVRNLFPIVTGMALLVCNPGSIVLNKIQCILREASFRKRFAVFTLVTMKITVVCNVTPCTRIYVADGGSIFLRN
jgi:hypothetical protein